MQRLKTNLRETTSTLSAVSRLRIRRFLWLAITICFAMQTALEQSTLAACQTERRSIEQPSGASKHFVRAGDIVISGITGDSSTKMMVWLKGVDTKAFPPMFGTTTLGDNEITFTPRFALSSKVYSLQLMQNNKLTYVGELDLTTKVQQLTSVDTVYPTASMLPENTLRFYVQFSGPMRKGDIYRHISIREARGKEVDLPFLEIEQEFWSRDSKRLTLLLDPGRIKRGLKPREEMGPIFESGKSYELVISKQWKDANGNELAKEFVKRFSIGSEDHEQPSPTKWRVTSILQGAREPLVIAFPNPLDHAMLQQSIQVQNAAGKQVSGTISVSKNETLWSLTPNEAWQAGSYTIAIDDNLEDPAGNSIAKQFDVDVFDKTDSSPNKVVELKFVISK